MVTEEEQEEEVATIVADADAGTGFGLLLEAGGISSTGTTTGYTEIS